MGILDLLLVLASVVAGTVIGVIAAKKAIANYIDSLINKDRG